MATATIANTSATPPIPSRIGQNRRILDAAVTLLVLAVRDTEESVPLLPPQFSMCPGSCSFDRNPPAPAASSAPGTERAISASTLDYSLKTPASANSPPCRLGSSYDQRR